MLTGYHIESIAIEAFRNYQGPKSLNAMIRHFFEVSPSIVLKPIKDKSGQSIHVDEYLGAAQSDERKIRKAALERISRSLKNADGSRNIDDWNHFLWNCLRRRQETSSQPRCRDHCLLDLMRC